MIVPRIEPRRWRGKGFKGIAHCRTKRNGIQRIEDEGNDGGINNGETGKGLRPSVLADKEENPVSATEPVTSFSHRE